MSSFFLFLFEHLKKIEILFLRMPQVHSHPVKETEQQ